MNINFAPIDEAYIKDKVESGCYSNATEMIRDAVRKMRENDEQHSVLLAALMVGEQQVVAGQVKPYTSALFNQIKRNARAKAQRGEKPNHDVLP